MQEMLRLSREERWDTAPFLFATATDDDLKFPLARLFAEPWERAGHPALCLASGTSTHAAQDA
ncbi:MAG TPA: hypothetical protein VGG48_01935 [Rhizomicrobium sp.]